MCGGELRHVRITRALAQRPQILWLDEPSNHLDIQNRLATLNVV